ncbi:MAG TPA: amino acid ABC transporter permease [Clostridia bacterium]|nr:amino acid ABC transporter permease [Clostridia bacterium]
MTFGHRGQVQAAIEESRNGTAESIVGRVAAYRARQRLRFRLIMLGTWAVLILLIAYFFSTAQPPFDLDFLWPRVEYILGGVQTTVIVAATSIFFATILAVMGALGRLSANPILYGIASLYVSVVRGTPLIVQILFVYSALPRIWPDAALIPLIVLGIFALSFNYGAYMTEIFRAGIQAVPRGQVEAAGALGMTDQLTMRRVVLPQATRIVTPAIGNEFIAMIKDSALVSVIGVGELLWRAQRQGQPHFRGLETLLLAALVYWALTITLSVFQDRLEKRMSESDRRV